MEFSLRCPFRWASLKYSEEESYAQNICCKSTRSHRAKGENCSKNETNIKKEKPIVFNSLSAHENNFHCLAKAIDRISVALCSNNGDNIEVRLREFLVVSESLNKHINLERPVVTDLLASCNKVVVKLISGCVHSYASLDGRMYSRICQFNCCQIETRP